MALSVGQKFANFEAFTQAVDSFGKETNAVFSTVDSRHTGSYQYVKVACKHFGKPRVKSKGIRPNQKSFKSNCPAFVTAKRFNNCVGITKLVLNHNHDCNEALVQHYPERRRLDEKDKKQVEVLLSYELKPSKLRKEVMKLTGKAVNMQDLCNLRFKIRKESRGDKSKLEEAIARLFKLLNEDDDAVAYIGKEPADPNEAIAVVNLRTVLQAETAFQEGQDNESGVDEGDEPIEDDDDEEEAVRPGQVQFIFFQTGSMRRTFRAFPEVVLMDNTYNVTESRMPLNISMVMDGFGSGRAVSYTFVSNEKKSTLTAVMNCILTANPEASELIRTVVIDKDFSEIAALRNVLPTVIIEICLVHVLKAFKEGSKDITSQAQKEATRKILTNLAYAKSADEYKKNLDLLKETAPEDVYSAFIDNWHLMKETWVYYKKLFEPNLGNFTNNRIENKNGKLKELVDRNCTLAETIEGILLLHSNKEHDVAFRQYLSVSKVSYVVGNSDPDVALMGELCTPFAAKLMREQIDLMDGQHKYVAEVDDTCQCGFYRSLGLPCRHIFLKRKQKGEPKFNPERIKDRWFKKSQINEQQIHLPVPCNDTIVLNLPCQPTPLTERERFKASFDIGREIADILAKCDETDYKIGHERLRKLRDFFRNGAFDLCVIDEASSSINNVHSAESIIGNDVQDNSVEATVPNVFGKENCGITCSCGDIVSTITVTRGANKGKKYVVCPKPAGQKCDFYELLVPPEEASESDMRKKGPLQKLCSSLYVPAALKVRGRKKGRATTVIGNKLKNKGTKLLKKGAQKKMAESSSDELDDDDADNAIVVTDSPGDSESDSDTRDVDESAMSGSYSNFTTICIDNQTELKATSTPPVGTNKSGTSADNANSTKSTSSVDEMSATRNSVTLCLCREPAVERIVSKNNKNFGRHFYCCAKPRGQQCTYFTWHTTLVAETFTRKGNSTAIAPNIPSKTSSSKRSLFQTTGGSGELCSVCDTEIDDIADNFCSMCKGKVHIRCAMLSMGEMDALLCKKCADLGEVLYVVENDNDFQFQDTGVSSRLLPHEIESALGINMSLSGVSVLPPDQASQLEPSENGIILKTGSGKKETLKKQSSMLDYFSPKSKRKADASFECSPEKRKELYANKDEVCLIVKQALNTLSRAFPDISGFNVESPFSASSSDDDYVQIFFDAEKQKWVTIVIPQTPNLCTGSRTISIYDSKQTTGTDQSNLSDSFKVALASMLKESGPLIHVTFLRCQQVDAKTDSAYFAIAYAVEFCLMRKLRCPFFKIERLKSHYKECVQKGLFTSFPKDALLAKSPKSFSKRETFQVFCLYCQPKVVSDDSGWVTCIDCAEQYHLECVGLTVKPPSGEWYCPVHI